MLNLLEKHRCFNGHQEIYSHGSFSNKCKMQFALYTPDKNENIPVLYFLSGITCTEQNFIQKSGYQKFASEHQMAIVVPDTSPRGKGIPDSESYKLGWGAGFYLNATEDPWSLNYNMYDYVTKELPQIVDQNFQFSKYRIGIFTDRNNKDYDLMMKLKIKSLGYFTKHLIHYLEIIDKNNEK